MEPVADIKIPQRDWGNKYKNWEWAVEQLKSSGYQVDRQGMGKIVFDPKRINTGLDYLNTPGEVAAFVALPRVLKRGIEIGRHTDHKGRDYGTVTFAAPVTINGKTGNMAVVVKLTSENFYKTHRILTPDGKVYELKEMENAELTPAGESLSNSSLAAPISSASDASVKEKGETVKRDYSLRGAREHEQSAAEAQRQGKRLEERAAFQRANVKNAAKPGAGELDKIAGGLLKDFSSQYDRKELTAQLEVLYDRLSRGGLSGKALSAEAESLARRVLTEVSIMGEEGAELRRELRQTKIHVPRALWADFEGA